ncbi:MAG: hypothetical protein ACRD1G_09170 [Acidimicrobiales bacterium]
MIRAPLAGAEVYEWVALRRVSGGEVTKVDDRWLERGHRVPGYIADTLPGLLADGLVMLLDLDLGAVARIARTNAGTDRYEQLCQQVLLLPGAQFLGLCRQFLDDNPDPAGATTIPD